jgi:hypothetical protein
MNELRDYLSQQHTPIEIKHAILTHTNNWLEPTQIIDPTHYDNNQELQLAVKQQLQIGWKHFIRGRLTIEWGNIIHRHLAKENIVNINAEKWGSDLLYIHWKNILKIWNARCEDLHGITPEQKETNKKVRLLEEISHIQLKNPNLAHTAHAWVLESITQLQNYTSINLQSWLYEATIISKLNQQKLKTQLQINSQKYLWKKARPIPIDKPIEKSDLDPGESLTTGSTISDR